MHEAAPDLDLIKRIAAKDRLACQALYARHHLRLYRFLLRLLGDEAIAEELTQDVFMEVWRNAARFEGRSAPSTWMMSIAHNKAMDRLRRRGEDRLDEAKLALIEDPADTPEETAEKRSRNGLIRQCLMKLSAEHREVIDLVYYHEKSIVEVSQIAGIPENTVKTRMFYARKKLQELFSAAGIEE